MLRLHYTGYSDRQVFLSLYPGRRPGAPNLGTFAEALHELVRHTEESLRRLALQERVPFVTPNRTPSDDECADIVLTEPVGEEKLSPGDEEALADLDQARAACLGQLRILSDPSSPPPPEPPPETGRWVDPAAERAKVVAMLAGAVSANVAVRLRGAATRIARSVSLHNLRLARKEEEEGSEEVRPDPGWHRPDPARGRVPEVAVGHGRSPGSGTSGFVLDVPVPPSAS